MVATNESIPVIVIASPHSRNDETEKLVRAALPGVEVLRVRSREALVSALQSTKPAWVFFPHWSWKIPSSIFTDHRCVIFHMTDLPYGRGGSPLQNLILRGHRKTKLSAIACVEDIDAGPVYLKHDLDLTGTAETILRRVAKEVATMIVTLVREEPVPEPQMGEVTHFERRKPAQSIVPEGIGLSTLYDFIRMLDADGYPHARIDAQGFRFEFTEARPGDGFVEAKVKITTVE